MNRCALLLGIALPSGAASLAVSEEGERLDPSLCSRCHGEDGNGGEVGPGISPTIALRSDEELAALLAFALLE